MSPPPDLRGRWSGLGGSGPAATAAGARLIEAWSEDHRRYHTVAHLSAVLDRLDELDPGGADRPALDPGGGATGGGAARVAAWYHDAVYTPGSADNEAASADLAAEMLPALGWDRADVDEVGRLVLSTVDHLAAPGDRPAALLCDADLAVLGSGPAAYASYVEAVRDEFAHVGESAWRRGRGAVLGALLARPQLYVTGPGATRWEEAARRNLRSELDGLSG